MGDCTFLFGPGHKFVKFVECNDVVWTVGKLELHVFWAHHLCVEVESLMLMVMNRAPLVEITLLRRTLVVSMSAVGVPQSPG